VEKEGITSQGKGGGDWAAEGGARESCEDKKLLKFRRHLLEERRKAKGRTKQPNFERREGSTNPRPYTKRKPKYKNICIEKKSGV